MPGYGFLVLQVFGHLVEIVIFCFQLLNARSHFSKLRVGTLALPTLFNVVQQRIFLFLELTDFELQVFSVLTLVGLVKRGRPRVLVELQFLHFPFVHICLFGCFLGPLTCVNKILLLQR